MPWVILASLASSVVSLVVSNITQQPTIQIQQADVSTKTEKELAAYKIGFFTLTGLLAVWLYKKAR